jgi:perosamine synthetase
MISIYKPYLGKYKKTAIDAINSEWISNHGIYVNLASEKICNLFNIRHCILMNNGTSATQCLLLALKFKYPNINKLYIPNNVFISPINCALNIYSKEQIEVMKINPSTLNIDTSEEYINSLEKNSGVLIVHNLGNIINVPRLKDLRPDLIFVEDNCEGIFGKYKDNFSGTESLCSALSFYGNKTITTGEGGAFLTNDTNVFKYISKIYSHGMSSIKYIHDTIGYNFRMTNVAAGFLYEQLCDIKHILELKYKIFDNYKKIISKYECLNDKIIPIEKEENTEISRWMYCMIIKNNDYETFEKFMNENGISIRPLFYDLRNHKHLHDLNFNYNEVKIFNNGFMLPSYPGLSYKEQKYIVLKIVEFNNLL